jgi:hypothetical protein
MVKPRREASAAKNGTGPKAISESGKTLRKISDAWVAAGGKV